MRAFAFIAVLGCFGCAPQDERVNAELARLQGNWQVVLFQNDGEKEPAEFIEHIKWTFKGNTLLTTKALTWTVDGVRTVKGRGGTVEETISLDLGKTPKEMTGVTKRPTPGVTSRAIYELHGDSLKICANKGEDAVAPKEFAAPANSGRVLIFLQRIR